MSVVSNFKITAIENGNKHYKKNPTENKNITTFFRDVRTQKAFPDFSSFRATDLGFVVAPRPVQPTPSVQQEEEVFKQQVLLQTTQSLIPVKR